MDFNQLKAFITTKMRMSHIYQPLLIQSLLESDNKATVRQLANMFLSKDESQIQYYEKRLKEMPIRVLKKHGIIEISDDLVSLCTEKLSFQERASLIRICQDKIQEYFEKRGIKIWDYRLLDDPVPHSLRYNVLKRDGSRCALCGATEKDRMLDVDHIIPRSRSGKTVEENLQILCSKCNRTKGNKDDTDFRSSAADIDPNCIFCGKLDRSKIVAKNGSVYAIKDGYPVTEGHLLIIPNRHTLNYFSMANTERQHAEELLRTLKNQIEKDDKSVTGFNIGVNTGESAGQTVMHAHIHLIPRRDGDVEDPTGGIRGVIQEMMKY